MSNRATIIPSSWKVFLDGVEVPHQGATVTFVKDGLSFAEISLEPDILLSSIRPQTVVSVWTEERFVDDDIRYTNPRDKAANRYYLFWEGLVSGYTHDKSHNSRVFRLKCESKYAVWQRIQAFSFAVGSMRYSPTVSGSVTVNPNEQAKTDIFTLASLASNFGKNVQDDNPTFSDRLISTVVYLSSGNASLRLHTSRYRLLNEISGIDDDVYEHVLAPLSQGVFNAATQILGEQSSVYDIITHLQSYGFYHSVELPIPVPKNISGNLVARPLFATSDLYDFKLTYRRNTLLFVPTNFFALPPPCNLIFPDMLQSLTVDRSFYTEPTRTIALDPLVASDGYVVYLAPPTIIRNLSDEQRRSVTSAGLFSMSLSALFDDTEGLTSPYISKVGTSTVNLLNVLDKTELEKGIIVNSESFLFETLSAYTRAQSTVVADGASAYKAYSAFITSVLNYRHKLAQMSRSMSVQLNGHRYLVPGFTAAIFDSDISYLAYVDSVSFSFNPLGHETSTVQLSYARPIQSLDQKIVNDFIYEGTTIASALSAELNKIRNGLYESADQAKREELIARERSNGDVEKLAVEYAELLDAPIPPSFIGTKYGTTAQLDATYGEALGCKKFYTGAYNRTNLSTFFDSITSDLTPQLQSILTYIEGIALLNNVYEMFPGVSTVSATKTLPSWQDIYNNQNALGPSTLEWSHRTFLKRDKLYMRDYLKQNSLALFEAISAEPSRTLFLHMIPSELLTETGSVGDFAGWDNSLFSKLPMEPGKDDPVITELRKDAPAYLRTSPRQKMLLEYATKHTGSRAFDGT